MTVHQIHRALLALAVAILLGAYAIATAQVAGAYDDPTDGICAAEVPADPPVEPVELAATQQSTELPVTGLERWVLPLAAVLLWLGGSLAWISRYDRRREA